MNAASVVLLGIVAFLVICGVGYIAWAAWVRIAAIIGRWQARHERWHALGEDEVSKNGRPHCEPIILSPLPPQTSKPEDLTP